MTAKTQSEVKLIKCRQCDSTQAFAVPDPGKTIEVRCHHCGDEVVKVTRKKDGTLVLDPPDMELISL